MSKTYEQILQNTIGMALGASELLKQMATQRNGPSGEQRQDLIVLSHALEDLATDAKEKLAERPAAKAKGNHDGA